MVLHLARGGYDPKEHRFLRQFAESWADFKVAYTRLAVITTDNQLDVNEFRDAVGAEWPFLADPERTVQKDLDIQEYTDPHDPTVPHTFVLEPGSREPAGGLRIGVRLPAFDGLVGQPGPVSSAESASAACSGEPEPPSRGGRTMVQSWPRCPDWTPVR
jgi:hypothetical protein